MATRTQTPKPKHRISHIIIKAIRDRAPNETYNDELAKSLGLAREQVRNSVRQVMRDHPDYGIRETTPYYYVYDPSLVPAGSAPISAAPHIPTYDELADEMQSQIGGDPSQTRTMNTAYARSMDQIFAADREVNPGKYAPPLNAGHVAGVLSDVARATCEFRVVARKGDVVILADEHDALWAAKKL